MSWWTEDSRWPSSVWVDLLQMAEGLKRRERPRERDLSLAAYRAKTSAFHCLQHQIPCLAQMRSCEKCAPTFLAPIFKGKKSFILIFNSIIYLFIFKYFFPIYLYLDTCFLVAFMFDHIAYKKFYVTNNYNTQE